MDRDKQHYEWRKRTATSLPSLGIRIFALRDKPYVGSGYHYDLERRLGSVMRFCNDFNEPLSLAKILIEPMAVESLYRDVSLAEQSVPA